MKTDRYIQYSSKLGQELVFTALYIKNGINPGTRLKTMLLCNICLNGVQVLDHIWVNDANLAHLLKNKQHKQFKFLGKLKEVTKPGTLYKTKKDLALDIVSIYQREF